MIGKVMRGRRVGGLLRYLFGPGRANEHVNSRLVGCWDGDLAGLEPLSGPDGRVDVRVLTRLLEQPLAAAVRTPARPVWHCAVRAAPTDRRLSDAQWREVARDILARTGLAQDGDDAGCRWVAVRHADDHIHLVVTLARQDGGAARTGNDFYRVGEACRAAEDRYGLARTAGRDRTAARRVTRAETEKAVRTGRREPARVSLQRQVRVAAAGAATGREFLDRLSAAGVLVRVRTSDIDPDVVTGYAVAWPGDRTADGRPVWFGGGRLAADLSWQKLSGHWETDHPSGHHDGGLHDGGHDSGHHVGHDTGHEVGQDAGHEVGQDVGHETGPVAGRRTGHRRDAESGPDTWPDNSQARGQHAGPALGQQPGHQPGQGAGQRAGQGLGRVVGRRSGRVRLSGQERAVVWRDAAVVAARAADEVRRLAVTDPAAASDIAHATGRVLAATARVVEGRAGGPLTEAADGYDRAARDLHGRVPPRTATGSSLRTVARLLASTGRAARDESVQVLALVADLAALVDAVTELRVVQDRAAQAAAARTAADRLAATAAAGLPAPRAVDRAPRRPVIHRTPVQPGTPPASRRRVRP